MDRLFSRFREEVSSAKALDSLKSGLMSGVDAPTKACTDLERA
jgi:hypothetical protein